MKKKKNLPKRIAALALSAALVLSGLNITAAAEGTDSSGTVYGEEETVQVSSGISARETDFNTGWKFYLGDNSSASGQSFDDSSWEDVTLPHDFSISQDFTTSGEAESGYLLGGTGWYRKSFTLSEEEAGSTIVLSFDGVYSDAYVYVNGIYVGENHYGYTSFAFDITDYLVCDGVTENVIAVKAVNNTPSSRWYSGSGIYRDVTLIVTEPVHVAYYGTYVTTPNLASSDGSDGTVDVEVELDNDSDTNVEVTVKNTVYTSDGEVASDPAEVTTTIAAGATETVTSSPVVENPDLWSTDDPNLYFVRTEVYVDGTLTDTYDTQFGFRWFSYDADTGFYLNGVATKLNGVCMHHDQGALGSAASYDAIYRQLSIMKDMGVNAIRTSHNPADEDFIDICNELGILVLEEAFDGWNVAKNGNSNDFAKYFSTAISADNNILGGDSSMTWAEYAIKAMVKRDRNDACVFMWSLGNEIEEGASTSSEFTTIVSNLIEWIQEVDDTRSFTLGDNTRGSNSTLTTVIDTIVANGGIAGFNYASSSTLATLHSTYGAILSTETSSAVNSRGIYTTQASRTDADGLYHLTSYDTSAVSWGITAHESMWITLTTDYVLGEFVWTGFDYIGEPTPWNGTGSGSVSGSGAIPNSSYFGIVDTAGFEKDTYYLYRAQWNQDSTTLHLVTAWDSDNLYTTSGKTPVVIYTNAAKVELYRNGTLIGTATRTVNTTDAGHTYYTYTTTSNDTSVCTAVTGSDSTSLYATFNVTYEEGTISAIAYDENGNVISDTSGNSSVSTPGTVSRLAVTQDKTVIDADGESLVYIEVDVTDADGNLDTTATNTIYFTLSGDGEIVGVDNGDQATTEKYQQSSVLTSSTEAHIAAYAGKALVIVRSTSEAGSFTVSVTSDGLTGGSATVTTTAVESDTVTEGLVSYTMVRDYSVTVGTKPELLTTATGTLADGSTVSGTIAWDEISSEIYNTAGDYTITGTLSFDGLEAITVTAKLHVIADVIAMRNVSAVTMAGYAPTLPSTVNGVLADGTVTGEFTVTWDSVSADDFAEVGDIITVEGTATVIGTTTLPVTCTVRVAETVNTESTNVAGSATVEQDIPSAYQSDTLSSLNNGTTKPGDNTSERWSNYNYRNISDTATLTLTWATAQLLSSVNLYYYVDSFSASLPASVEIAYSLDGTTYTSIGYTESLVESYTYGYEYSYEFDEVINPIAIQITLTEQSGKCVALTEIEAMTYAGSVETYASADLSDIAVDGTSVSGFDADTLTYEVDGTNDAVVTATTDVNAGITVLPIYTDDVVRILTVSEDGSTEKTYEVTLSGVEACQHENTVVRNASAATCTTDGYTGDTYCADCGALVEAGSVIPATSHSYEVTESKDATCTENGSVTYTCSVCGDSYTETTATTDHTTEIQNAKAATCTEDGYTGDEVCTVCGVTVSTGSVIAATGHSWDSGVVTKEATYDEEGEMTYTCTVCGETKTETIPMLEETKELLVPSVTLSVSQNSGKIRLTGTVTDYENSDDYYEITGHGFVYITKAKLGSKSLSLNTSGRTKLTINGIGSTGSYSYSITPASASTVYVIRAWISYTNSSGKTVYVYSDPIYTSYNALTE